MKNPYHIGEVVRVKAWWFEDKRVVSCVVTEANDFENSKGEQYLTVQQLIAGFPIGHCRWVNISKEVVEPRITLEL